MPLNWPTSQLRDLADVRVSNVDKKSYAAERPIRLCNYMDVYANDYLTSALLDFMPATASPSEIERFALHAGDVVITKDSETPDDIGVPAVIVEDIDGLVCGYHLALIRPKANVHPIFLAKQLASAPTVRYFAANATGSTRFGLAIGMIERLDVPTPPPDEQAKIAEVLSTVDRAIEQTEALIAKQQRIKTGLMQDLLTRGIDEHGNLRSEQTHKFRDSPLGRIPVEWECASFGDCWGASPQNGLYKPQSQYSDDGTPIIRIDGFRNGDLIDHQTFRRVRLAPAESRTFALKAGDLLLNRVNSIEWLGKAALVGSLTETTVFESNMMRIRVDQQWLIPEFAILLLSSPHAYHHFRLCAKTAIAQASINQEDARSLLVALPHRVEQQRVVDTVHAAHRADGRLKGATLKLRLLRTGLMQDLLTGDRRVTPLLEQCERVTT